MEDNARPNIAASTQTYLENRGIPKIEWSPQSPDLNPIENLWLKMKREVSKKKKIFKSADDVMATIRHVWGSLSSEDISKLYESMPIRLRDIIKMRGHRAKFYFFYQYLTYRILLKNAEVIHV